MTSLRRRGEATAGSVRRWLGFGLSLIRRPAFGSFSTDAENFREAAEVVAADAGINSSALMAGENFEGDVGPTPEAGKGAFQKDVFSRRKKFV